MEGYPKTKWPIGSGGSITVTSPEQEKALGPGWQDHPPFEVETPAHVMEKALIQANLDMKEAVGRFEKPKEKRKLPEQT